LSHEWLFLAAFAIPVGVVMGRSSEFERGCVLEPAEMMSRGEKKKKKSLSTTLDLLVLLFVALATF
jgi:hypothetical protein